MVRKESSAPIGWPTLAGWALLVSSVGACDARSYDASCSSGQTATSVPGAPCDESAIGQIACALPSANECTPRSSTVVECSRGGDAGGAAPSWKSVFTCPDSQVCYFLQPFDGALPVSNVIGCGVNDFPQTLAGLPCSTDGSLACSFDTTTVLDCEGGIWTTSERCAAPELCGGVACASDASGATYCVGCQ